MLLLDVQVDIAKDKDKILNEWYYAHVPRLVSIPGYESGRRYVSLTPGPRYLALYEIRDHAALPLLLGDDHSKRHPLTLSEWSRWDHGLAPHMSHCRTNLYEPEFVGSAPILHDDHALALIRFDMKERGESDGIAKLQDALNHLVVNELDYRGFTLLKATTDPSTAWLKTTPDHLLVVECAGLRNARDFAIDRTAKPLLDQIGALAKTKPEVGAYRLIARHWSWS